MVLVETRGCQSLAPAFGGLEIAPLFFVKTCPPASSQLQRTCSCAHLVKSCDCHGLGRISTCKACLLASTWTMWSKVQVSRNTNKHESDQLVRKLKQPVWQAYLCKPLAQDAETVRRASMKPDMRLVWPLAKGGHTRPLPAFEFAPASQAALPRAVVPGLCSHAVS